MRRRSGAQTVPLSVTAQKAVGNGNASVGFHAAGKNYGVN
ncbi:hypothetical protein CP97_14739 [Aurantiacibacter atlanticus]|uniref:Uncharacterized protein n=1 Tax=Aurantiacibacter atlanticus TaxID=1648404 RepID=A0A168M1Q9_9SPHN|nr:hypothetical protein CP97_14739 [Aurantiacibacter atlanticus]